MQELLITRMRFTITKNATSNDNAPAFEITVISKKRPRLCDRSCDACRPRCLFYFVISISKFNVFPSQNYDELRWSYLYHPLARNHGTRNSNVTSRILRFSDGIMGTVDVSLCIRYHYIFSSAVFLSLLRVLL